MERSLIYPLLLSVLVLLVIGCGASDDHLSVSKLYSDNMVIQRDQPIKVWGKAKDGSVVKILFNKVEIETSSFNSNWYVELPKMSAGGPYEMMISSGSHKITVKNILLGDVWICSGQSNMEFMVSEAYNSDMELSQIVDSQIRHFKVMHAGSDQPSDELLSGEWAVNHPDSTGQFTAVGYYFAKMLRKEINVPIGLINSSWGGSRIESWINPDMRIKSDREEEVSIALDQTKKRLNESHLTLFKKFPEVTNQDMGISGLKAIWANPDLDVSEWVHIDVPSEWERAGFDGLDGIGWYRSEFELTKDEVSHVIEVSFGKIDDCDRSFVNGIEIGGYCNWESQRVYQVGSQVLKEGINNITIRVEDGVGGGGISGEPSMLYIKTNRRTISLVGKWKFRIGAHINMSFAGMYNGMIHPLTQYPIKGILWYQGESNTNSSEEAQEYRYLFSELINNWRHQWAQEDMPFLFVQLANFKEAKLEPVESNWAILRQSQSGALSLPNIGQVVIIDIGDSTDIHPRNKKDVGVRLALAARKIAYGQNLVFSGPVYKSHVVKEDKIIISFDHIGTGLVSKGSNEGAIYNFAIAAEDGKFVWANAKLINDKVLVWNDQINRPKKIRYAWADNPEKANLYNVEGLPAAPFEILLQEKFQ